MGSEESDPLACSMMDVVQVKSAVRDPVEVKKVASAEGVVAQTSMRRLADYLKARDEQQRQGGGGSR